MPRKQATRAAYGVTLAELAGEGVPVVAVDADLTGSTTTKPSSPTAGYAERLFNCGIAEQNMIDVAAGLATHRQHRVHGQLRRVRHRSRL